MKSTTILLLERYKDVKGFTSDYETAKALGVTRAAISRWRQGAGTMDEATALYIAGDLGLDPIATLAEITLDRRLSPRDRRIWEKYRARVSVAVMVAVAATGLMLHPGTSLASVTASHPFDKLYIMRTIFGCLGSSLFVRLRSAFRRINDYALTPFMPRTA